MSRVNQSSGFQRITRVCFTLTPSLRLLRSELGAHCMQQWREVQWQGPLLDDLENLRELDGFYSAESSVLQLQVVDEGVVMVAGGLATRC